MSKFSYENKGEFQILDCQCEVCEYYNNGTRSEICPKELLDRIIKGEILCPEIKEKSVLD